MLEEFWGAYYKKPRLSWKNVSRYVDVKSPSGDTSYRNEEYVIGHWMKGDLNKVAKNWIVF